MAIKGKSHRGSVETETTLEGLTALIYHVTHAAAQKQLDPEFARVLGKHIEVEYNRLTSHVSAADGNLHSVEEAMARFQSTVLTEEGQLLSKALTRLRSSEPRSVRPTA